jgi:hypothetical protein
MTQAQTARCAPCLLGAAQSRRGQEVSTHGCWGHAQAHPQDPATEQKRHTHTANTEAVACGAVGTLNAPAQIGTHWHLASPSCEVWTGQRSKHAAEPQRRKSMHTTRKGEAHKRGWRGHAQPAHPHNIQRRRKEPHCQVGCHNRLLAEYHGHTAHGEDIACPRQVATDFKQLRCS